MTSGWFHPTGICYFHGREVGFTDGLSSLVLLQHFPMLVIMRWGVPQFKMGTWYDTSLAYMVWYIVDLYGTVHCWFLSKA